MKISKIEKVKSDKCILSFFGAFVVSLILCLYEIVSVINFDTGYDSHFIFFSVIILLFWFFLFIWQVINKKYVLFSSKKELLGVTILFILIAIYLLNSSWCTGYLSLNPAKALVEGTQHQDNLFHSSIAGGIAQYGQPILLINKLSIVKYHVLSHAIIGVISRISSIPSFLVYCYIYPILFLPLYIFLLISVICDIKYLFQKKYTLSFIDVMLICGFIIGFLPTSFLSNIGIKKTNWIVSESYLVSIILLLLYLKIIFVFMVNQSTYKQKLIMLCFINPLFIVLTTLAKVSVGCLLCVGIIWYLFRRHIKELLFWIIEITYGLLFLGIGFFSGDGFLKGNFLLFAFVRYYVHEGFLGAFFHYFYLLFSAICIMIYVFTKRKVKIKEILLDKEYLYEEIMCIVCLVGLLPGFFLKIVGGSAGYFSYPTELLAFLLFFGYDIPNKGIKKIINSSNKFWVMIPIICLSMILISNANIKNPINSLFKSRITESIKKPELFTKQIKQQLSERKYIQCINDCWTVFWAPNKYTQDLFYKNLISINKLSIFHKDEYAIYLDESANVWKLFKNRPDIAIFVYPAMTNILCLNEVYSDNQYFYTKADQIIVPIDYPYVGMKSIQKENKKSFDEVINDLPKQYRYVIYIKENEYQVLTLDQ